MGKKLECEVEDELELYILAKELHLDIDVVKSWPLEKQLKWMIALRKMAQEIKESLPQPQTTHGQKEHLIVFR